MSRVAKMPVSIPPGVEVKVTEQEIQVKGSNGLLSLDASQLVTVRVDGSQVLFEPANETQEANALSGTYRAITSNMVQGVTKGFERKLNLVGVGYRAQAQGAKLNLQVGYSHPVVVDMPDGIKVETPTQTEIILKGANRQVVGQLAAEIRSIRPPEPYKGKGIRYADERVTLKETKKK